jgi:hypothetical protein
MTGVETASHTWRWRKTRYGPLDPAVAARAGEPCRVFARGRDGKVGVEFADGLRVVAPRWAIRRRKEDGG